MTPNGNPGIISGKKRSQVPWEKMNTTVGYLHVEHTITLHVQLSKSGYLFGEKSTLCSNKDRIYTKKTRET